MTNEHITVDLYIRVSTEQQANEGDSLEEQESELRKFCAYRNFHIRNVFIERGRSAKNTKRPEYQKLVQDITQNRINAVVVKKLDRLSRSLLDFEQLMTLLHTHNVEFISLKENFDTTTAMGKAMLRVALVFAQLEREQTSERITDVMTYRASKGLYNGGIPPFGYTVIDKALAIDPREKKILDLIFKTMLTQKSCWHVARTLNSMQLYNRKQKPWTDSSIQRILANNTYIGNVFWKGNTYPGIHPPLISQQIFDMIQTLLKSTQRQVKKQSENLFKKQLYCGQCNLPMSTSYSLNRKKIKFHYYVCTSTLHGKGKYSNCKIKRVNMHKLDELLLSILSDLSSPNKFNSIAQQIQHHNQNIHPKLDKLANTITQNKEALTGLQTKQNTFLDALINPDLGNKERDLILKRIDDLKEEEKQLSIAQHQLSFTQTDLEDTLIDQTQFKENLVRLTLINKSDKPALKNTLQPLIQSIQYTPDQLIIQFTKLPFPIPITISQND